MHAENCKTVFVSQASILKSHLGNIFYFIFSYFIVCVDLWKNPAHKNANSGFLSELNHLLQKACLVN